MQLVPLFLPMPAAPVLVCGPVWVQKKRKRIPLCIRFNRNFAKRADGNPNTYAFVGSPEMVTAMAIAGDLTLTRLPIP